MIAAILAFVSSLCFVPTLFDGLRSAAARIFNRDSMLILEPLRMAERTNISWCDSTWNPWIGCTKVGPGCDHCYAEAMDKRHRWGGAQHWGGGVPRMRTSASNWAKPLSWNRAREKDGKTHRVFCASLADVFDNEVPARWRSDLFDLIKQTPALTWLLLTKRIGNVERFVPWTQHLYRPANVWIGATIVNQEEADRDIPKLLAAPAEKRFVSYEPALGPVDWTKFPGIDWIIVGGESTQGAKARPFDLKWAADTILQAEEIDAAPFVKQLGSLQGLKDRAGADVNEWPIHLRVREFPQCDTLRP